MDGMIVFKRLEEAMLIIKHLGAINLVLRTLGILTLDLLDRDSFIHTHHLFMGDVTF